MTPCYPYGSYDVIQNGRQDLAKPSNTGRVKYLSRLLHSPDFAVWGSAKLLLSSMDRWNSLVFTRQTGWPLAFQMFGVVFCHHRELLGMGWANEKQRYNVTSFLIGSASTQRDSCVKSIHSHELKQYWNAIARCTHHWFDLYILHLMSSWGSVIGYILHLD